MKTITQIFKDKPELLEQKEVLELIEQFSVQFNSLQRKHENYWMKVTDLTMSSNCYVLNGTPCEEVIKKINELSFN